MDFRNVPNLGRSSNGAPVVIDESVKEGISGTVINADLLNPTIQELHNLIVLSGLSPSSDNTQVYQIIQRMRDALGTAQSEVGSLQSSLGQIVNNLPATVQNVVSSQVSNLDMQISNLSQSLDKAVSTANSDIAGAEARAIAHSDQGDAQASAALSDLTKRVEQYHGDVVSSVASLSGTVDQNKTSSDSSLSNVNSLLDQLQSSLTTVQEEVNKKLGDVTNTAGDSSSKVDSLQTSFSNLSSSLSTKIEQFQSLLNNKADQSELANYVVGNNITQGGERRVSTIIGNAPGGITVGFSDGGSLDLASNADLGDEMLARKQAEGIIQLPIGTPILWPTNDIPNGFILFDGRQFGKIDNPVLLSLYPSGNVPDMRGLVPRGYDPTGIHDPNGPTRGLLSFQEGTYVKGPETQWSYPITFGESTFPNSDRGLDYVSAGKTGSIHNASPGPGTGGLDPYQPGTSQMSRYGAARMKNMSWNFIGRVG